jgi:hypothetical protein
MLALPAPFGLGEKSVHVSLRAPYDKHFEVRLVAVAMGCPNFIADRVEECIRYSGRYDCLLNPAVDVKQTRRMMHLFGGDVVDVIEMERDPVMNGFTRRQPSATLAALDLLDPFEIMFDNPYQGLAADEAWRRQKERLSSAG